MVFEPFCAGNEFSDGVARIWLDGADALLRLDGTVVRVPAADWVSAYCYEGLIQFQRSDRWGYLDREGRVVIPPAYEATGNFSEGLAGVKIDGKLGYIDARGAIAIEPRFDEAASFREGLARVTVDGRDLYIDRTGAIVIRTHFHAAFHFFEGVTPVYIKFKRAFDRFLPPGLLRFLGRGRGRDVPKGDQ